MTFRSVISKLVDDCLFISGEMPVYIMYRDENGGVVKKVKCPTYNIINAALYIEEDFVDVTLGN